MSHEVKGIRHVKGDEGSDCKKGHLRVLDALPCNQPGWHPRGQLLEGMMIIQELYHPEFGIRMDEGQWVCSSHLRIVSIGTRLLDCETLIIAVTFSAWLLEVILRSLNGSSKQVVGHFPSQLDG